MISERCAAVRIGKYFSSSLQPSASMRERLVAVVEQLSHSAFAFTDPGLRLSRTRLSPKVTRIMPDAASTGA
ncbi:hypothetical protein [Azospirillum sp. ST 5-10]|uniref:hypothetical protein n=1 Tax=Azospirillum sp. ST 5-10 TaxID=3445776 RepID=UPI003F4A7EC6